MPSRWESSQRPLFVKSVWMDGYRHAILSEEDPAGKSKSPHASHRALTGKQELSSRPKSKTKSVCDGLVIPAVKLLFVNVQRVNAKRQRKMQPEQDVVKSITFNVITRAPAATAAAASPSTINMQADLTPSARPAPTNQTCASSERKINIERIEQCSNSLTERVLLWLDLAGRYTSEIHKNMQEEKQLRTRNVRKQAKRGATAHPNSTDQKTFPAAQADDSASVRKCSKQASCDSAEEPVVPLASIDIMEEYSILNNRRKILNQSPRDVEQESSLLTSEVEMFSGVIQVSDHEAAHLKPYSHTFSKRQIHIFMPLLSNKNAEVSSVLSDNLAASISSVN